VRADCPPYRELSALQGTRRSYYFGAAFESHNTPPIWALINQLLSNDILPSLKSCWCIYGRVLFYFNASVYYTSGCAVLKTALHSREHHLYVATRRLCITIVIRHDSSSPTMDSAATCRSALLVK
jgi:hypothetical protein